MSYGDFMPFNLLLILILIPGSRLRKTYHCILQLTYF